MWSLVRNICTVSDNALCNGEHMATLATSYIEYNILLPYG